MAVGEIQPVTAARTRAGYGRVRASAAAAPLAVPVFSGTTTAGVADTLPVDLMRAQHDAQILINSIDWTQPEIVIWVPGTGSHSLDPAFEAATRASWNTGGVSLNRLEYEASDNLSSSVATGVATLRLVLAEIARRGGNQRVLLAGQGQGAWVIGEALTDPAARRVVARAALLGHPHRASTHYAGDAAVFEFNDPFDRQSAGPAGGSSGVGGWLQAMFGTTLLSAYLRNPADYSIRMTDAVEFLRSGLRPGSSGAGASAAHAA